MTTTIVYGLWIGLFLIGYTYLGYGLIMILLTKIIQRKSVEKYVQEEEFPEVTHIIAAYNEESFIREKISNSLSLHYPKGKYHVLIVTDGSTDSTPEVVRQYPDINHFHTPERKGKIHAVNRVMRQITTPVVVFSDANTLLNPLAIKNLVQHFKDARTGGVSGEKRIMEHEEDNASGAGEGLYWKYESFLKRKDAELSSIMGAAGELFCVRTHIFEEPPEDTIIEDFYLSFKIVAQGYRFLYEPEAMATETGSATVKEEWKRKVRICAGGFQAMSRLMFLLNPFKYGWTTFQYVSHRVLRWTLAPLFLPIILIANIYLVLYASHPLYFILLTCQGIFYGLAWWGFMWQHRKVSVKGFFVPYYFVIMNLSVFAGFWRFLKGKQSVVWERAQRA